MLNEESSIEKGLKGTNQLKRLPDFTRNSHSALPPNICVYFLTFIPSAFEPIVRVHGIVHTFELSFAVLFIAMVF